MNSYFYRIENGTDTLTSVFKCNSQGESAFYLFEEYCNTDFPDFIIKNFNKI